MARRAPLLLWSTGIVAFRVPALRFQRPQNRFAQRRCGENVKARIREDVDDLAVPFDQSPLRPATDSLTLLNSRLHQRQLNIVPAVTSIVCSIPPTCNVKLITASCLTTNVTLLRTSARNPTCSARTS